MNDNNTVLQAKIDSMTKELQVIAVRIRDLVSPLNAIRFYVDDLKEDFEYAELKTRLADIDRIADKCMNIIRELIDLTMAYFK